MNTLTATMLRELLDYDPETGVFRYKARGREHFVDQRVCNSFNARFAGSVAGTIDTHGHRQIKIAKEVYAAHRVAWLFMHGEWPTDQIDHINGVRDDNRIANLRNVTSHVNCRNKGLSRSNTSGVVGVSYMQSTGRWRAAIKVSYKTIHLGVFDTKEEAAACRKAAEQRFGFHPNHGRRAA